MQKRTNDLRWKEFTGGLRRYGDDFYDYGTVCPAGAVGFVAQTARQTEIVSTEDEAKAFVEEHSQLRKERD